MTTGKFYAMAIWAGHDSQDYIVGYYYRDQAGVLQQTVVFTPAYYQSMCARLYNFEAQATTPSKIEAIAWQAQTIEGQTYKVITDVKSFTAYAEAQAFVNTQPTYSIVGANYSVSPIPLDALEHYKLIYTSTSVKIFEYLP
jgi:hypothetical protein